MKPYQKLSTLVAMALLASTLAAGCNTVKGAGKDIQKGGEAVEDAAESAAN